MTIESRSQSSAPGNLVQLFQVDMTPCGIAETLFFVKRGAVTTGEVVFDGVTYTQIDIEAKGFRWDGSGTFPRPTLSVSTVSGLLTPYLVKYDFLIGATVTVITTFDVFLDGAAEADPAEHYPAEIYTVEQMTNANAVYVSWVLSSIIDQTGQMLPGRVMMPDICPFKYRERVSGSFQYYNGECPYDGTDYFDENDNSTTAANDRCSHRVSGCEARYGSKKALPFGGFPGISKRQSY